MAAATFEGFSLSLSLSLFLSLSERDRDRQTDRQTDRERQRDRQRERQRERDRERQQFKMLVASWPIFVADTKIIFGYNFEAPLSYNAHLFCKIMDPV